MSAPAAAPGTSVNPFYPANPFGTPGSVNLMSTGVNIAVSVLIGSCLLLGICAGFIRVRRQQRAHQAWLAQRQRGAINRAVQVFGMRLHEEEAALDPALNPFTPQPLIVVSPDGQDVAVARQYKEVPPEEAAKAEKGAEATEKPQQAQGLTTEGAEALARELNFVSLEGVPHAQAGAASPATAPAGAHPEPARMVHVPFGQQLKVKTFWSGFVLLDPEPEEPEELALRSATISAPANDVVLDIRQNMEAMRTAESQTGPVAQNASEPRRLGFMSSLKAMVNARQHFPEDGPLVAVPEASAVSGIGQPSNSALPRLSGSQRPTRVVVGGSSGSGTNAGGSNLGTNAGSANARGATYGTRAGRLPPLPMERQTGQSSGYSNNPLLDSSRSEAGLLANQQGLEMTQPPYSGTIRSGRL